MNDEWPDTRPAARLQPGQLNAKPSDNTDCRLALQAWRLKALIGSVAAANALDDDEVWLRRGRLLEMAEEIAIDLAMELDGGT